MDFQFKVYFSRIFFSKKHLLRNSKILIVIDFWEAPGEPRIFDTGPVLPVLRIFKKDFEIFDKIMLKIFFLFLKIIKILAKIF